MREVVTGVGVLNAVPCASRVISGGVRGCRIMHVPAAASRLLQ